MVCSLVSCPPFHSYGECCMHTACQTKNNNCHRKLLQVSFASATNFACTIRIQPCKIFYVYAKTGKCLGKQMFVQQCFLVCKCWRYLVHIHKFCEFRSPEDQCFLQTEANSLQLNSQKSGVSCWISNPGWWANKLWGKVGSRAGGGGSLNQEINSLRAGSLVGSLV